MKRAGIAPQQPAGMAPVEAAVLAGGLVLGAALLARGMGPGGSNRATKRWYRALEKPGFTPPGTVIGSVWTVLDALMGIAGFRLLRAPPSAPRGRALGLWAFNVAMIPGWTALFFTLRSPAAGLAAASAMFASALSFLDQALKVDRLAALAAAPFAAWTGFAGVLNEEVWRRNR